MRLAAPLLPPQRGPAVKGPARSGLLRLLALPHSSKERFIKRAGQSRCLRLLAEESGYEADFAAASGLKVLAHGRAVGGCSPRHPRCISRDRCR